VLPANLLTLARYRDQQIQKARESKQQPLASMPLMADIPFTPDVQYREPDDISRFWVVRYARHVAQNYKHEKNPDLEVIGVKVYRVIHQILPAAFLASGVNPYDRELLHPYFMGEFDKDGVMKPYDVSVRLMLPDGSTIDTPRDPLLYWLIPIMRPQERDLNPYTMTLDMAGAQKFMKEYLERKPKNYLLIHAGDVEDN
jgi:hypothetical protein